MYENYQIHRNNDVDLLEWSALFDLCHCIKFAIKYDQTYKSFLTFMFTVCKYWRLDVVDWEMRQSWITVHSIDSHVKNGHAQYNLVIYYPCTYLLANVLHKQTNDKSSNIEFFVWNLFKSWMVALRKFASRNNVKIIQT